MTDDDVWVTAVPAIQQFCQRLDRTGDRLHLRLTQRLSLSPDANYSRIIELWVRPQDLARPCPDPEVTDRECELEFLPPPRHVQVSDTHRTWFQELKQTSYGPVGYPFTGLGDTYAWNPSTEEVRPSEFFLRPALDSTTAPDSTGRTVRPRRIPNGGILSGRFRAVPPPSRKFLYRLPSISFLAILPFPHTPKRVHSQICVRARPSANSEQQITYHCQWCSVHCLFPSARLEPVLQQRSNQEEGKGSTKCPTRASYATVVGTRRAQTLRGYEIREVGGRRCLAKHVLRILTHLLSTNRRIPLHT